MEQRIHSEGQIIGRPGAGLTGVPSWAANADVARIGQAGELRTAEILDEASRRHGIAVLHDLRIPIPGIKANIDHVVVSGRRVLLVDAKVWRPGVYWTVAGRTFRGLHRFSHAEKKTMQMAARALRAFLQKQGIRADIVWPLVVVWPSRAGTFRRALLRVPGARVIPAGQLARAVARFAGRRMADRRIVDALSALVAAPASPGRRHQDARRAA
ncbi:nuclease-related domain-containing protein [Promicromonospora sp. NPDC057138]|uniref:nuclease-related domain-containing protein n=1 Tax=Promicromonospora sp. NPDC057138 TaxID=3346031 RepID=UPI003637B454